MIKKPAEKLLIMLLLIKLPGHPRSAPQIKGRGVERILIHSVCSPPEDRRGGSCNGFSVWHLI